MSHALHAAIESRDADRVEEALNVVFAKGLSPDHTPALIELLGLTWHSRHEDIALCLQELKPPEAVPALLDAARRSHPQYYDDGLAFIRKCTWTLADIGTPEAHQALITLADSPNPEVAHYADKRLQKWEAERHRKRVD